MRRNRVYISKVQRRMFFLSFVTAFVAAFTQTLAVLIDHAVVCAFYSEAEIAAVSLAGPFFYLLEIPAAGLATGIQTVCAKEIGSGQIERANRHFNQLFFLSALVLIPLTILSFLFLPQMTVLFGARGKTAALQPYAIRYLYGLSFEIVPYVLFCILTPIVILDNGGRLVSLASVCGCVTDIVLDLMSVRFGWGLLGIGLASSASAIVYFLITMLHFLDRNRVIKLYFVGSSFRELREVFRASLPKAFLSLADTFRSVLFITLVSVTGGVAGICVLTIFETINYFVLILSKGIAGAVGIMAGICYGEKNGDDLEGIGVLAHRYNLILSGCVMAILTVCVFPLSNALTKSTASAKLLVFAFFCLMITFPFSTLVQARISYLQAVGKVKESQSMGIGANLAVLAVVASLLSIWFGVHGVFLAFPISKIVPLFISWGVHSKRTRRILPQARDYLEVDESFFVRPGDVIDYPILTKEDCTLASEQIVLFCRGHKLDEKKCFLAGLCAEELTTNAIKHGTSLRQAIRSVDIRVVIDGEDVIIRTKENGPAFNLKRFAERLAKEDDPEKGIGVRILVTTAKNVSYYRTHDMNTTIITV